MSNRNNVGCSISQQTLFETRRLGEQAAQQRSRDDLLSRLSGCNAEHGRLASEVQAISQSIAGQELEVRRTIEHNMRDIAITKQQLNALGFELREQRAKLGPSHPDVEQLQNQIMELDRHRRILQQHISEANHKLESKVHV